MAETKGNGLMLSASQDFLGFSRFSSRTSLIGISLSQPLTIFFSVVSALFYSLAAPGTSSLAFSIASALFATTPRVYPSSQLRANWRIHAETQPNRPQAGGTLRLSLLK